MKQSYSAARSKNARAGHAVRRESGSIRDSRGTYTTSGPGRTVPKIVRDATNEFIDNYRDALKKLEKF